ncbi:M6 family metalloprotease-like protein [Naumannella cuiyingiana]|uniref:M6 family metalloprotease-like protein n=1 Tax=Naumannella cuiyingiana TaxID=1347891 RepID=A0A7Z0DC69_9ACTN|nr:immune inhibitor A domain-containing protein [Naumannella cuiyingiana]NYI72609.1 M6 family metalloprotease-like protein [Naumannella cuiyingiana]
MFRASSPGPRLFARRPIRWLVAVAALAGLLAGTAPAHALPGGPRIAIEPASEIAPGVAPIDPQQVADLDQLTWDDYVATPGADWSDPGREPTVKKWRAAIVLLDYPDEPFQVTQPKGSTPWGNPDLVSDLPREDVPQFFADFLNKPSELNRGHTLNEYWMETSAGRYGVELVPFGPYRLPKKSYQYHFAGFSAGGPPETQCPKALKCNGDFRRDALAEWRADTGMDDPIGEFDNVFYVGAGMDESATWLEFGQKRYASPADIPDELGPPPEWREAVAAETGKEAPRWADTRYVDWTSWKSAASMWPNASGTTSIEAESSGAAVYAHELSHNLSIGDNYGNPYAADPRRDASGVWDMLSRGSFNGPGGQHERWHVPSDRGAVMGAQLMLRDKMTLKMVDKDAVVRTNRSELTAKGIVRTRVQARAVQGPDDAAGMVIGLDGGDRSTCVSQGAGGPRNEWRCDGGGYDAYTLEVVDRMGSDSFTADSGVLLAKTKDDRWANPGKWVIDANPDDIGLTDYVDASGTPVPMTRGDHRQLNDGLFKAGAGSGSAAEYTDRRNGLRFYVLGTSRDERGVLSYDLAVRSLEGAGPQRRGVTASAAAAEPLNTEVVRCTFTLTNTGRAARDADFADDVYRVSGDVADGSNWRAVVPNEFVAAAPGETVTVQGYAVREPGASAAAVITFSAASEGRPGARATSDCAAG